jgi:hypothetical protein
MSLLAAHSWRVGPRTMWASKDITITSSYSLLLSTSEIETAIDKTCWGACVQGGKTVRRVHKYRHPSTVILEIRADLSHKPPHPVLQADNKVHNIKIPSSYQALLCITGRD